MTDKVFQSMEEACHGTRFSEQDIEDFCVEMGALSMAQQVRPRIEWTEDAVRIIRQLQNEQTINTIQN